MGEELQEPGLQKIQRRFRLEEIKNRMKITLSGDAGSGKGTMAQMLSEKLGWPRVSAGDFKRGMARKKGMTILDFDKQYTDKELDEMIDGYIRKSAEENDNLIVDAWRGFHHVPTAFKVFLQCKPEVAAKRIYEAKRGSIEAGTTVEEIKQKIQERYENNRQLMLKHDDVDLGDLNNYDLAIDTTPLSPKEVLEKIIESLPRE